MSVVLSVGHWVDCSVGTLGTQKAVQRAEPKAVQWVGKWAVLTVAEWAGSMVVHLVDQTAG